MNRLIRYIAFPLLLLGGLTLLFPGEAAAITIDDVARFVVERNLNLKASTASNAAEEALLRADNTLPPTSIEFSPFFRPGVSGMASSELIVSQEFDFPTLYGARSRQAGAERRVLDAATSAEAMNVAMETKEICLDIILAQKEREILLARIDTMENLERAYETLLRRGSATQLDLNRIRLNLQDLRTERLNYDSSIRSSITSLSKLVGVDLPDLHGLEYNDALPDDPSLYSIESLIESDPSIKGMEAEVEAARSATSLARSGWLPSLSLGYRRNTEDKDVSNGFLVGATFPIFSNSGKVKAAAARLNAGMLSLEARRQEKEAEMRGLLEEYHLQATTLQSFDDALMEETLKLYAKSLAARQITMTDYLAETGIIFDRMLTRVRLENDLQRTAMKLLRNIP